MMNYSIPKKAIWQFITQKFASLKSNQVTQFFLLRGKSERIDKIHFAECSGLRPERQKKKVPLLITQFGKEDTHIILLSA